MNKKLTVQQELFIIKKQEKKAESDECLGKKQLESWARWVDSRVIQRKLKNNNLPYEWIDKYLDNSWYTMTSETFKLITDKYKSYNN